MSARRSEVERKLLTGDVISQDSFVSYSNNIYSYIQTNLKRAINKHSLSGFDYDNEVTASITLVPDNKNLDRIQVGNFSGTKIDFILTNVSEQRTEKYQVFETFGAPALFFFDKKVSTYTFSGYLIDGEYKNHSKPDGNNLGSSWAVEFKNFWEENFRGTKLVNQGQIAFINFNKSGIWGYPVNLSTNVNTNAPFLSGFSFNMIVTKHKFNKKISSYTALDFLNGSQREYFKSLTELLKQSENKIRDLENNFSNSLDVDGDTEKLERERLEAEALFNQIMTILRNASVTR